MNKSNQKFKKFISCFFLNLSAVIFFVISHPSFIFERGLGFFAFFIYLPVLLCVHKASLKSSFVYGVLFGAIGYGIYAFWIFKSYPEFLPVIFIGYGLLYGILYLLLKVFDKFYGENSWILQWLLICSVEFLKTFGFLGLSYGVTAYSQWKNTRLIQICDITGIYGLNALIILFSAIVYSLIQKTIENRRFVQNAEHNLKKEKLPAGYTKNNKLHKLFSRKLTFVALGIWIILFGLTYVYGFISVKDYSKNQQKTVAAIQNNENSWLDGIDVYTKNIQKLMNLTDEALEIYPDIDLVVWPETAVVPAITENYYYPKEKRRAVVVNTVLQFMNSKQCDFITGNGHKVTAENEEVKLYNSALHFVPSKNVIPPEPEVYSKMKLVPFTEYFPYKNQFPWLYKTLKEKGLLSWDKGNEYTTFDVKGLKASSLICFEDTFPDIARNQYKAGSRCFICLSNDSWSKSVVCQNQHLAIALFRSVENRIPSVRSTATGETCIISPNGEITSSCPEFCEDYLVGKVPVIEESRKTTLYCRTGEVAGWLEAGVFLLLLIIQTINVIIRYINSKKN